MVSARESLKLVPKLTTKITGCFPPAAAPEVPQAVEIRTANRGKAQAAPIFRNLFILFLLKKLPGRLVSPVAINAGIG
jgi:hypothetical protein